MKIEAQSVEALLNGNHILKGEELEIGDREFVGIIGPNGSGKSTLLKCIYRVLKPTGGAVYLDGKSLDSWAYRDSARRLAVVAQHNYYNFDFSVRDVVLMGRAPHKRPGPGHRRGLSNCCGVLGDSRNGGTSRIGYSPHSPAGSSSV